MSVGRLWPRAGWGVGGGVCAGASGKYVTDDEMSNDIDMIFLSKGAIE